VRSPRGMLGAVLILLAVPAAVLTRVLVGSGDSVAVHLVLAAGSLFLALAVFDYGLPKWITWIGCAGIGGLAVIFLLQTVADMTQNDALNYLAYQVLGSWPERLLPDLFIFWLVALLLLDSRGWTRIFGFAAMAVVVGAEVYGYAMVVQGDVDGQAGIVRALYLLPFLWLLLESAKRQTERVPGSPSRRSSGTKIA
jgi:hypothetical protein